MTYALILVPILTLLLGGCVGYYLGRNQATLLDRIRELEAGQKKPKPEKPTVIMGAYTPPTSLPSPDMKRAAGLVETKTPELLEYERQQAIEKEVLGR